LGDLIINIATSQSDRQACFRLRHLVFVEEQGVPVELELDEFDDTRAIHFLGKVDGEAVAASRVVVFGDSAKIQRVVVHHSCRGRKFGKLLMLKMMDYVRTQNLAAEISLDAQTYAIAFYQALGFEPRGEEFDDAGIPHIHMVQPA